MGYQDIDKYVSKNEFDILETQSPIQKQNDGVTLENNDSVIPDNNVENDVVNIVSNIHDENLDNFVSDDEHVYKYVKSHTIVSHIGYINNNVEKKKSAKKNKKKADKKKTAFKPQKTPTKIEFTPSKAKRTNKKKWIYGKKKKSVVASEKSIGKKKAFPIRKVAPAVDIIEDDVEDNFDKIMVSLVKKKRKIVRGKKIHTSILVAPIDKLPFHSEESMLK